MPPKKFVLTPLQTAAPPPQQDYQSYNIDAEGNTFTHQTPDGAMSISDSGMKTQEEEQLKSDFKLEDLQILEKLGEGASSVVHKAYHPGLDRYMALKRINVYDRASRHQIVKELQTLSKSSCPQLISFYGAFFKDGSISIALELMDANSLGDLLKRCGSIPEPYLAYFTCHILAGLYYLRRKHAVHRDIKPSNICLNSRGIAKLSDFGITTELKDTLHAATSFVGTSLYMSPERILGSEYKYPSDIWSLGLTLLECATGKFPYPNTNVVIEMTMNIVKEPSPTLPSNDPNFSNELRHFIDSCLQKDPEKRATAEQLLKHPWLAKHSNVQQSQVVKWMQPYIATKDKS